jgi:hypothetical protein
MCLYTDNAWPEGGDPHGGKEEEVCKEGEEEVTELSATS